jgi:hypothetical protein
LYRPSVIATACLRQRLWQFTLIFSDVILNAVKDLSFLLRLGDYLRTDHGLKEAQQSAFLFSVIASDRRERGNLPLSFNSKFHTMPDGKWFRSERDNILFL